jgi:gas vesicle protein
MDNKKALLGIFALAAAGAVAGVLFAPDKGSKTRKKLKGKAEDLQGSLRTSFDDFMYELKKAYRSGSNEAEELSERAMAKINALKADVKTNLS